MRRPSRDPGRDSRRAPRETRHDFRADDRREPPLAPRAPLAPLGKRRAGTPPAARRGTPRGAPARAPRLVPTRWLKTVAGLFLLPVCWVASRAFFAEFTRAALTHQFWLSEEFYFFMLGVVVWTIAFFGLPRPLLIYVFGHELTHALWVLIQGGRVSGFKVGRDGGYIIADKRDFFVSLAPYFFPLYSIAVIGAFWAFGLFYPVVWQYDPAAWWQYRELLFMAIGATWAFHFTFTCWMIPKQQPDLLLHGTFFSLIVIYLANLTVLAILLVVACPQVSWGHFGATLLREAMEFSAWVCAELGLHPEEWWREWVG